jgi:hypothetical protein
VTMDGARLDQLERATPAGRPLWEVAPAAIPAVVVLPVARVERVRPRPA